MARTSSLSPVASTRYPAASRIIFKLPRTLRWSSATSMRISDTVIGILFPATSSSWADRTHLEFPSPSHSSSPFASSHHCHRNVEFIERSGFPTLLHTDLPLRLHHR